MAAFCVHISLKHFKLDFYYMDIAKSILSSIAMYLFVSSFSISGILELFEAAGAGTLIYLIVMFMVGGFTDHEMYLIKRYLFRSEVSLTPSKHSQFTVFWFF